MFCDFKKYVIASDMDGTFLGKSAKVLDNNLEAIKYFTDNGGIFLLATGRCRNAVNKIFPNVSDYVNSPSVICGGSYLYDFRNNEFSNEKLIDYSLCENIVNTLKKEFSDIGLRISFEDGFVCPVYTDYLENGLKFTPGLVKSLDVEYLKNHRIHKIVYTAEPEKIKLLSDFVSENIYMMENLFHTASSQSIYEILPNGASKGVCMQSLKKLHGTDKIYVCVGDYLNDLDMLTSCDLPASPENACETVKNITKIHLCENNDGCIADLIYKLQNFN